MTFNPVNRQDLRSLSSVDRLLKSEAGAILITTYGRELTVAAFRDVLENARAQHTPGQDVPAEEIILMQVDTLLERWTEPTLVPVINATGVVVHTNLGRAPLSTAAQTAMEIAARGYSNLEYDLDKGRRGSRSSHSQALLQRLTGAEAALVVNNNAAAVLLALTALARRRRVVIARSQLVEIGGGFRVPDVMRQSNAKLLEVGTTNRVHLLDYEEALTEPVALIMRAHRSNFQIIGFTSEPELAEITAVAHRYNVPVLDDLGSGALLDTAAYGLGHEPTVQESLEAGVDLVCFSGDKLVGGPQAGIIVGRADLVAKLKKHPLARAVRADKLCLAALSATLTHYLKSEVETQVPVWRMISASPEDLRARAAAWVQALGQGEVIPGLSTVGGGSLPEETLPTSLMALSVKSPNRFLGKLRKHRACIIARIETDRVVFDPRTVLPEQEETFLAGLQEIV